MGKEGATKDRVGGGVPERLASDEYVPGLPAHSVRLGTMVRGPRTAPSWIFEYS
jgi:hypothetical protein